MPAEPPTVVSPPTADSHGGWAEAPAVSSGFTLDVTREIRVPDYTLIKRVGSGAYGEVWLAQSVTGALRAVKIVWRQDFELTRTFHREFEGIQQFEPISRGHPGLVHILHVGWNEESGYYYYVMEIADDALKGPHIDDVVTYTPRTLSSDMKHHGRLDLHFCQEAGAFIADALHYMHVHGLTHRDIKPSNIIYCGGVCKLADIGLVAVSGERSFVGTEGFVPPEGPGTPQADLYSLGKVLYEMSSGKDRMEFPEVPDDLEPTEHAFWKNFNRVICRACAPDLNERFATGEAFADALRAVNSDVPLTATQTVTRWLGKVALFFFATLLCGAAWVGYLHQRSWSYQLPLPKPPAAPSLLPESGKPWRGGLGHWFSFQKDRHVADQPVDLPWFNRFLDAEMRSFEGEVVPTLKPDQKTIYAVVVPDQDASDFCDWMTHRDRSSGRLTIDYEYRWKPIAVNRSAGSPKEWQAITCEIVRVSFGRLSVSSTPSPAQVYAQEELLGTTPLVLNKMEAGAYSLEVRYPGYKTEEVKGSLKVGQNLNLNVRLKNIRAIIYGKPWENSLKLKLVPLGHAMIGATEVRQRDFKAYLTARRLPSLPAMGLDTEADQDKPIASITRAEATQFCDWLTEKEQATELIDGEHRYRLPTDDEWSMAASLPREKGDAPADRQLKIVGIYPWGYTWPPDVKSTNLLDEAAALAIPGEVGVKGYKDNFAELGPVASMKADWRGLTDLSGNVWEWVEEPFGGTDPATQNQATCRGGGYTTSERTELLSGYRRAVPADGRYVDIGFRLLLTDGRLARDLDQE
jgi:serine/threonine protein kinase/formylglycine-generating enzyme required for sulfatase activity